MWSDFLGVRPANFWHPTPGMTVLVTHRNDRMSHERLLLYPVAGQRWIVLTPNE
jgi:hypothetical protein